jgi:hypothetical protein
MAVEKAVSKAGFKTSELERKKALGNRILEKYVRSVEPATIIRQIGASEVRIAKMALHIAEDSGNTPKVRLSALELLAKCLAMTREEAQGFTGAEIIISAEAESPGPLDVGEEEPPAPRVAVQARVRTITR